MRQIKPVQLTFGWTYLTDKVDRAQIGIYYHNGFILTRGGRKQVTLGIERLGRNVDHLGAVHKCDSSSVEA